MSRIFKIPFATQGDRDVVPVPTQGDGSVSMTQGFGIDYEREYEDPAAKDIRREVMNGLFYDITQALGELQSFGFAQWAAVSGGWPVGAMVRHDGKYWQSHENANEGTPGDPETGLGWKEILLGNVVPATEAIRGLVHLATAADAKTFTGQGAVTAQVLGDAMNSHVLGMGQTWRDETANRALNTVYTNTTGRAIAISIYANVGASGGPPPGRGLTLLVNSSIVARMDAPSGDIADGSVFTIVPPSATYRANGDGLTLGSTLYWWEFSL